MLDPVSMLDTLEAALRPRYAFKARTAEQARTWQRQTRAAVARCLGFQRQKKVPLQPRQVQKVDRGDYVRYKIVIRTTSWTHMPMYVLVPKGRRRPGPVVMALHGHGYGVKDIVGLWEDGSERYTPSGYHKDFGCALAMHGFVVIAPEISCFGERTRNYDHLPPNHAPSTCHHVATYAAMLGGSALGLRVWDTMRAIDYALTRPEVDAKRIGAMGISGGGMLSFFTTALDRRIKACVVSGYFCNWRHSILAMNHCACNFVPGLLQIGRLEDLAGLIAPRPCLVENADHDTIFPLEHVRRTVRRARRSWSVFGATDRLQTDFFEGRHEISGARAYDFLAEHLGLGIHPVSRRGAVKR